MTFRSAKVVAYWPFWTDLDAIVPDDIDLTLIDVVAHYAVWPSESTAGNVTTPSSGWTPATRAQLIDAVHDAQKKVVLVVGGDGTSDGFPLLTADGDQDTFVGKIRDIVEDSGYDGVDLDWEWPANATDQTIYESLIVKFRDALNDLNPSLSLSVGAPANHWNGTYYPINTTTMPKLTWFAAQTYNLHGPSWSYHPGHVAGIHSANGDNQATSHPPGTLPNVDSLSFDSTVAYWLGRGVPRNKLYVGSAFTGARWNNGDTLYHDIPDDPPHPGSLPDYSSFKGTVATGWTETVDWEAIGSYYTEDAGLGVISGPTIASVQASARFLATERLPGIILWALGKDLVGGQQELVNALSTTPGRTRTVWLSASEFTGAQGATRATVGGAAAVNRAAAVVLPYSASTAAIATTTFLVPADWEVGTRITVIVHWSRPTTALGNVDWEFVWAVISSGDQVDEGGIVLKSGVLTYGSTTAEAQGRSVLGSFAPSAAKTIRVAIRRQTTTTNPLTTGVWLLGVELQYTDDS